MAEELQCCVVECERPLDKIYWDSQYVSNTIGWDLGEVSPPIKKYIDALSDKNVSILIPGCGNSYEAEYLVAQGFTNITVIDIAPTLIKNLKQKFQNNTAINVVLGDFFEHQQQYDIIIEQTFFCALPPTLRQKYVWKMYDLLKENGHLVGLLFNRSFEQGPPFGGSKEEYIKLFDGAFEIKEMDITPISITPRANTELWFDCKKNNHVQVAFYSFEGITCNGCMKTVTEKFSALLNVINVSMSNDFKTVLLVSKEGIETSVLQNEIAYDAHYKIVKTS